MDTNESLDARAASVDRLLQEAADRLLAPRLPRPWALIAVGGYGRRELFPHSDIDLLLLFESEPDAAAIKQPVSELVQLLWDHGLKASQSIRTVAECCRLIEGNFELTISLLDARPVTGDAGLFDALSERLKDFYRRTSERSLQMLAAMVQSRHDRFENTVHHLEPNIKEGCGGIRDIHFVFWAAELAPGKELLQQAIEQVSGARDFLYRLRSFLHDSSRRDQNVLSFDMQDEAAARWGPAPVNPAAWMRIYYRHARTVFESSRRVLEFVQLHDATLLRQFLDRRNRLSTAEFTIAQNRVLLRNPTGTLATLVSTFALFSFVSRHGIGLSWDTQRRVSARAREFAAAGIEPGANWSVWQELLRGAHCTLALHAMDECGILALALPEWSAIESLVVRDYYHRYTVDEHTLVAIGTVDGLQQQRTDAPQRFRDLAAEEDSLATLRMALLLHDIGKGTTPGEHVTGSVEAAEAIAGRLGMPPETAAAIEFLIAQHLLLSEVMNRRDPEDPATARLLTARIPTAEDLRRLTLLTYADISAVNPTAMSPWRAEQLWRVYSIAAAQFTRDLADRRIGRGRNGKALLPAIARERALAGFLEGFPTRYLRTHTPEQIAWHLALEETRQREGTAVGLERHDGTYLLTVLARDTPGLFASLCGALASFGMNILKAEAAANASRAVLDELRFSDPVHTLELNPDEADRLKATIEGVTRGAFDVKDLLRRRRPRARPRTAPRIPPLVRFDNEASDTATLIDFTAEDRPGLLFSLASALTEAGCDIQVVLVNTEAHRALDVFYVQWGAQKLDCARQERLERSLLRAAGENI